MASQPMRIGTRGSPLALWQARHFASVARAAIPALAADGALEEHIIATSGDKVQDKRLADIGGKGLFAKEIHEALADRRIDVAVHSLKDLETELPPGIVLACVLEREDPRDALILGAGCGAAAGSRWLCRGDPVLVWQGRGAGGRVGRRRRDRIEPVE